MTYLVGGWAATGLKGRLVHCAKNELANFDPPSGQTCGEYLSRYLQGGAPGQLYNPKATSQCEYCPLSSADQFLAGSNIHPSDGWRNFGIGFAYIIFNVSTYFEVHCQPSPFSDHFYRFSRVSCSTTSSAFDESASPTWLRVRLGSWMASPWASGEPSHVIQSRHRRAERRRITRRFDPCWSGGDEMGIKICGLDSVRTRRAYHSWYPEKFMRI